MKILCVFGKYAYGDPARELSPEYVWFIPALEALGHTVIHFESWQRDLYRSYADLNLNLFKIVTEEMPDILFSVQLNYEIWTETLIAIRNIGQVATVCWTTDDSWKYREVSRFIGRYYDVISTTYEDKVDLYKKDGIPNVIRTQWAANSLTLQPPIPAEECQYKVTFIGAAHGNRKQRISKLREAGVDVACFGYGWPNGPVKSEAIPAIIQRSVISLNFANSKGENQIKARNFEVPGAGGFLLSESAPGLAAYYRIGKEIDTFSDDRVLESKINHYLANYKERDQMALAAFSRTKNDHTYEQRLKKLIDFAMDKRLPNKNQSIDHEFEVLKQVAQRHTMPLLMRFLRQTIVFFGNLLFGPDRGGRAARRLVFELSWRLHKEKTFSAIGLPGRMFPEL